MVGGGLHFRAHGGSISNATWLRDNGFDGASLVVTVPNIPSPAGILAAGLIAGLNPFNGDVGGMSVAPPGTAGAPYTSYFQGCRSAGWQRIAGEGVGGDVVRVCMNYFSYENYAGQGGVDGGQIDAYNPPWSHPRTGGYGHYDFIETYINGNQPSFTSTINRMREAQAYGSLGVGILIGAWMPLSTNEWISLIDSARNQGVNVAYVCYWTGLGYDIVAALQNQLWSVHNGLKNHYGVLRGSATVAPTPLPRESVNIAFAAAGKTPWYRSSYVGPGVQIRGHAGYGNVKYAATGETFVISKSFDNGKSFKPFGYTHPDSKGNFSFIVYQRPAAYVVYRVNRMSTNIMSNKLAVAWLAKPGATKPAAAVPKGAEPEPVEQDYTPPAVVPEPGQISGGLSVTLKAKKKKKTREVV